MKRLRPVLLSLALVLAAASWTAAFAQSGTYYNQRDDKYRVLGLKRAKEMYEVARNEYGRQKELFNRGLISKADLDRAQGAFGDAEVNYQQSLLAVLFEQQYVSVSGAVKYQATDGSKHVRLTLVNASAASAELQKLLNIEDKLFRSLQPDVINNVYVSILNNENAIISRPYELKIAELRYGQPRVMDFAMLQDLDAITVNMIYGNGSQRSMKIFLQKDAAANKVIVQSEQFSQEVELGTTATYNLTLELFSRMSNTFSLQVVNLPQQINRFFKDPANSARLSQFRFTESINTSKVALEVSLPDRPTEDVPMDRAISFYVLVVPQDRVAEFSQQAGKQWTPQEIEKLNVGCLRLELLPRGKGRLLVRAPQLFHSIKPDGTVEMTVEVVNEGTRRLDNIEVKADPPLNWVKTIEPAVVSSLGIGEEKQIHVQLVPPKEISPGRYETRLRTSALSDNEPVNAEDKTVTVEVLAETSILGTTLLALLILGLVGGMVVFGIRLSRK
jgi:hypothetical protein